MNYQRKIYDLGGLADLFINKTKPFLDLSNKELMGKYAHNYFWPEDPVHVPKIEKKPGSEYWLGNFAYYTDITTSFERLFQAYAFMGNFHHLKYYNFHRINELTWLRYHFELYLQENYILRERTNRWISSLIIRARRKSLRNGELALLKMRKAVNKTFENINMVRGSHVHNWRYDPKDFQRVDSLNFLISKGKLGYLKSLRNIRISLVLANRQETMWKNNHILLSIYDTLLGRIKEILLVLE